MPGHTAFRSARDLQKAPLSSCFLHAVTQNGHVTVTILKKKKIAAEKMKISLKYPISYRGKSS